MVRALLAGMKTQTRRAVRKQFAADAIVAEVPATTPEGWQVSGHSGLWWDDAGACIDDAVRCPYGMPGGRLWVREAWARAKVFGADMVVYREGDGRTDYGGPWKPGIHMFRRDSRITLEVTDVRVERLQDISEADAQAEGIAYSERYGGYCIGQAEHFNSHDPRQSYFSLWEAINGPGSVEANPWVWVVAFKVGKA
jgi:hypothetical protein